MNAFEEWAAYKAAKAAPPSAPAKLPPITYRGTPRVPPKLVAGDVVGEWTLIKYEPTKNKRTAAMVVAKWLCRCSCGVEKWVQASNLGKSSKSCGHARETAGYGRTYNAETPQRPWQRECKE